MIDHQPFLDAITANPSDDTPRLIYADWLEDRGECARAEFIRVQCELEKHPRCVNVRTGDYDARDGIGGEWVRAFQLCDRECELWANAKRLIEWFPLPKGVAIELGSPPAQATSTAFVRRGFVSSVRCTLADWCGGPCEKCNGEGGSDWDAMNTWNCTACGGNYDHRGTGTTTGHADEICLRHPIESVTLTNLQPRLLESNVDPWACWVNSDLTPELFDLLERPLPNYGNDFTAWYLTEADALAALDRAAVKLGRERAEELRSRYLTEETK